MSVRGTDVGKAFRSARRYSRAVSSAPDPVISRSLALDSSMVLSESSRSDVFKSILSQKEIEPLVEGASGTPTLAERFLS